MTDAVFDNTDDVVSLRDCPDCPVLVAIKGGFFRIGAAAEDSEASGAERPTRVMRIAPFAIGRYEVTIGQYLAFQTATGRTIPNCPKALDLSDPQLPMTCVTWRDAQAYVAWLSAKTSLRFRLPSEAEWEFSARAGSGDRYMTGSALAASAANVGRRDAGSMRIGSFPANAFGLKDIHGNVAELVADCWVTSPSLLPGDGTPAQARGSCGTRVIRDAGASEPARAARFSARRPIAPDTRDVGVGFRVARN